MTAEQPMPKKIFVSKEGYASCPACLNHVRLDTDREKTVCPFCDEKLLVAAKADTEGSRTLDVLRSSRSGLVASALVGAGLSLSVACTEPTPDDNDGQDAGWNVDEDAAGGDTDGDDAEFEDVNNPDPIQQDYGDFANDEFNYNPNDSEPDAGQDADVEDEEPEEENQDDG